MHGMKNFALLGLLAVGLMAAACDQHEDHNHDHPHDHTHGHDHGPSSDIKVLDPVCGMSVSKGQSKGTREANGITFGFCADGCLKKYDADPKKYAWGFCACKDCKCNHCAGKPERCACKK